MPKKVIRINLEELHEISLPEKSAVRLLAEILRFYKIEAKAIYGVNPDVEQVITLNPDGTLGYVDVDIDAELRSCEIVVELFDGYETAYACISQ